MQLQNCVHFQHKILKCAYGSPITIIYATQICENVQFRTLSDPSPKYNIRFYGSWKALTSGNCGGNITFKVY